VKNNKIHIFLSGFFLVLLLVSRVGLHVLHHHGEEGLEFGFEIEVAEKHEHSEELLFVCADDAHEECGLCELDAFSAIEAVSFPEFSFWLSFEKAFYSFSESYTKEFLFFYNNRGPPAQFFIS
jgi:hypothetical protein